jgi:hypothetical protein
MIVVAVHFPSGEVAESQISSLHGLHTATIPRDRSNPELLAALRDGQDLQSMGVHSDWATNETFAGELIR